MAVQAAHKGMSEKQVTKSMNVKASTGLDSMTCTKSELVASTLKIVEVSSVARDDSEWFM